VTRYTNNLPVAAKNLDPDQGRIGLSFYDLQVFGCQLYRKVQCDYALCSCRAERNERG
jgi:hypothetical protein